MYFRYLLEPKPLVYILNVTFRLEISINNYFDKRVISMNELITHRRFTTTLVGVLFNKSVTSKMEMGL